jgi:UDP-N-acetylmuramoylalanine--D-glutamate ligase
VRDAGDQHAEDPVTEVAVVGLGASGVAAARLALSRGEEVYVSDTRSDATARSAGDQLRTLGADVGVGVHDLERIAASSVVVVSPGIPPDAAVLESLRGRGVRWISEPEFAFRFFQGPLIAVTGTNGKTTTAALTAHLLESAGVRAGLGGNIGAGLGPAASELALREPTPDWYVLEMSSFQLADIETFRPDVGVVTNLAPDHLDRYPSVDAYYADKARLFDNADASSRWVLNADDPGVIALAGDAPGSRFHFSLETEAAPGAFLRGETLMLAAEGTPEPLIDRDDLPLLGRHNVQNALAAALAARLAGARSAALASGLRSARALPHRLEPVLERSGVLWVDDSKATNVAAARSAIESLGRPIVLLLGGKDKGEDFRELRGAVEGRVRRIVAYGAARERIAGALEGAAPLTLVEGDFTRAVAEARRHALSGDAVLLAPACSSFDMFENYERRGEAFAALARETA